MVTRATSTRHRRNQFATILFGALSISIGLAFVGYVAGRGRAVTPPPVEQRAYVPQFQAVDVPVPDRPIPAGTLVREIPVRYEKFPEHQLPAGVVRELGAVRDAVTLVALPGGLPILQVNIGSADEGENSLSRRIPPGMRAMSIKIDASMAVDGLNKSGVVVDVLLLEKNRTTVVAEQVKVISLDRQSLAGASTTQSMGSQAVTLVVTQEQCLAINTAMALGKISFAVRHGADSGRWKSTHFAATDLSANPNIRPASKIEGVVSFGTGSERKSFALIDGAWIASEHEPKGFFVRHTDVR